MADAFEKYPYVSEGTLTQVTPRWVEMKRDGQTMWLDMIDGQFAYGGDLAPTAGARLFMDELGKLLDERVQEAARKLAPT